MVALGTHIISVDALFPYPSLSLTMYTPNVVALDESSGGCYHLSNALHLLSMSVTKNRINLPRGQSSASHRVI